MHSSDLLLTFFFRVQLTDHLAALGWLILSSDSWDKRRKRSIQNCGVIPLFDSIWPSEWKIHHLKAWNLVRWECLGEILVKSGSRPTVDQLGDSWGENGLGMDTNDQTTCQKSRWVSNHNAGMTKFMLCWHEGQCPYITIRSSLLVFKEDV